MKNSMAAKQETGFKVYQKKNRRSRKPKFEIGKSKRVYDKKKKDKERKQIVSTQIAKLSLEEFQVMFSVLREANRQLEEFPLMFTKVREANRQLKELNSEIEAYIFDKLATWDDGDN